MIIKNKTVIFLGQWNDQDPLFRIYFQTLSKSLKRNQFNVLIQGQDFDKLSELEHHNLIINFFYKDQNAVKEIEPIQLSESVVICFGSDIFSFSDYANSCSVADMFVCPSKIHQLMLKTTINKPVEILVEALDPLIQGASLMPNLSTRRLVWFGFPESYSKSMVTIAPVIQLALRNGWIDSFTVISLPTLKPTLPNEFEFINYDENTVSKQLSEFDFSLLSHFPLDGHINTYIKSSNKAVYSVMSGLLPICSSTPNYQDFLSEIDLKKFLFQSPDELASLLSSLKNIDRGLLISDWTAAHEKTMKNYSAGAQLDSYTKMLNSYVSDRVSIQESKDLIPVVTFSVPEPVIKFRFYLRQKKKRIFSVLKKLLQ